MNQTDNDEKVALSLSSGEDVDIHTLPVKVENIEEPKGMVMTPRGPRPADQNFDYNSFILTEMNHAVVAE